MAPIEDGDDAIYALYDDGSGSGNFLQNSQPYRCWPSKIPAWPYSVTPDDPSNWQTGAVTFGFNSDEFAGGPTPQPTGSFDFSDNYDNGTYSLGSQPLEMADAGMEATLPTLGLSVGRHKITAYYPGDAWYHDGCGLYDIGIQATVCVTANVPPPAVYGQPVELDATVAPTCPGPGVPTPAGTLTFAEGTSLSETRTLEGSGTTSLTTSALSVGTHNIMVTYSGDANYLAMPATQMYTVVVSQDPTTTTVSAGPSPSTYGQPVNISATVAPNAPGSRTPTGRWSSTSTGTIWERASPTAAGPTPSQPPRWRSATTASLPATRATRTSRQALRNRPPARRSIRRCAN